MRIKDIPNLKGQKELLTVAEDTSVLQAIKRMKRRNCGSVLVLKPNGALEGLLTHRDIVERVLARDLSAADTKVADVMCRNPVKVRQEDAIQDAMKRLSQARVSHLPVVDAHDHPIGILSQGDFVTYTWSQLFQRLRVQTKASFLSHTQLWALGIALLAYAIIVWLVK